MSTRTFITREATKPASFYARVATLEIFFLNKLFSPLLQILILKRNTWKLKSFIHVFESIVEADTVSSRYVLGIIKKASKLVTLYRESPKTSSLFGDLETWMQSALWKFIFWKGTVLAAAPTLALNSWGLASAWYTKAYAGQAFEARLIIWG